MFVANSDLNVRLYPNDVYRKQEYIFYDLKYRNAFISHMFEVQYEFDL